MITNVWMLSNLLILWQFYLGYSGDFITIYDITDDGNSMVIASLTGPDVGPISSEDPYYYGHWQKKIISSTSNKMLVEFRSDDVREAIGFIASIHYTPLPSKECDRGLDMADKTLQSLNFPNSYDNNLACKWLISVPHSSHITLKFLEFVVRFLISNIMEIWLIF